MKILHSRRARALCVVVVLLTGNVTVGLLLWREGLFDAMGWLGITLAVMFTLGLARALGLLQRSHHRGIVVLWCRCFGENKTETSARNRWMWAIVSQGCRGSAYPVTLQDPGIQGAQAVGRSVQTPLIMAGILLGIPLWGMLVLWISDQIESDWLQGITILVGLALYFGMFVAIGRLAIWMSTSLASVRSDPKTVQRMLRATKNRGWAWREMEVIRCTHDDWQEHVAAILEVTDLVIADGTEPRENVAWEIELAQSRLGNEGVLLFSPEGSTASNGLQSGCLRYNTERARGEIMALRREWGDDEYGEGKVILGSYGRELVSQLGAWIESHKSKSTSSART